MGLRRMFRNHLRFVAAKKDGHSLVKAEKLGRLTRLGVEI